MEMSNNDPPSKRRRVNISDSAPFVLRTVLEDVPLTTETGQVSAITCLEFWNDNLYIGTSAGEILHFVSLPGSDGDQDGEFTLILASRLQPSGQDGASTERALPGVQKILVLPGPLKACVLCNGVVSFYSLPELSPAFPNTQPSGVQWIGGMDENEDIYNIEGLVVMVGNQKRILLVRVGEKLRQIRNSVEFPACLRSSRRDTIACVADEKGYALVELEHQQKIPLFPISSIPEEPPPPPPAPPPPPTPPVNPQAQNQRDSSQPRLGIENNPGHGRSTSMGHLLSNSYPTRNRDQKRDANRDKGRDSARDQTSPPPVGQNFQAANVVRQMVRSPSPGNASGTDEDISKHPGRPRSSTDVPSSLQRTPSHVAPKPARLKPHILSPSPSEFMLTTGTSKHEAGVGMFVNLDGDVVRGTIEFRTYPVSLVLAEFDNPMPGQASTGDGPSHIVALLQHVKGGKSDWSLEFHKYSDLSSNVASSTTTIPLPVESDTPSAAGIHQALGHFPHKFSQIVNILKLVPFQTVRSRPAETESDSRTSLAVEHVEQEKALFDINSPVLGPVLAHSAEIDQRLAEEVQFVRRFSSSVTNVLVWQDNTICKVLENPLLLQLDARFPTITSQEELIGLRLPVILQIMASMHGREAKNEIEFFTLGYIRQKASVLMLLHLLASLNANIDLRNIYSPVESALHDGDLDPRAVLSLLQPLANEVLTDPQGLWLAHGVVDLIRNLHTSVATFEAAPLEFWYMIRHYLTIWQEKRGYASIRDEKNIFDSVDAALLHTLLYLDFALPGGSSARTAIRVKLNNVIDHWKGDFHRAAHLLEKFRRLFLLSRLYQSRKQSKDVLATWKRILDGEHDDDPEAAPEKIELRLRGYLPGVRDAHLVQDYCLWLAKRNPDLAVQLLTDDSSRVKFPPELTIDMLKEHAPAAVQQYLEHLVFGKHLDQYADDLIGYYLDSVINVLEKSEDARESLAQSYSTYRALSPPKPTYLNFIRENMPGDRWWQSRLRLLQLLGSGGYSAARSMEQELTYSIPKVLERLAPFTSYLVSECIILDARQGRHKEALRLLTHGLGDYDSAVRYCYFGGPMMSTAQTIDAESLPSRELQEDLFKYLYTEFLAIADPEERIERTSDLIGKFAGWFEPLEILSSIPDEWPLEMLSEFLVRSFRAANSQRNQAILIKALSAAQNLQKQVEFIQTCESIGAKIEAEHGMIGDDSSTVVAVS